MSDQELDQDDLETVSSYMRDVAAASVRADPLPPASLMWWKAELEARRYRRRRVVALLDSMEAIEVLVAVVGAGALAAWGWQDLARSPIYPTWAAAGFTAVTLATATLLTIWDTFVRVRGRPRRIWVRLPGLNG